MNARRIAVMTATLLSAAALAGAGAPTLDEASAALEKGDLDRAQQSVEAYVAAHPQDAAGLDLHVRVLERRWLFLEARSVFERWLALTKTPEPAKALRQRCDQWAARILELATYDSTPALDLLAQAARLDLAGDRLGQLHAAYERRAGRELAEELLAPRVVSPEDRIAVFDLRTESGQASPRGEAIARAVRDALTDQKHRVVASAETARALRKAALADGPASGAVERAAGMLGAQFHVSGRLGAEAAVELRRTGETTLAASAARPYPFGSLGDREIRVTMTAACERREKDSAGGWTLIREAATLSDGDELRDSDAFQLTVRVDREAFVYVLHLSSGLQVTALAPAAAADSARVAPNAPCVLPKPGHVFLLDDVPGLETVYVFASFQPLPDLERLLERLRAAAVGGSSSEAGLASREVAADLSKFAAERGLAGVAQGGVDGITLSGEKAARAVSEVFSGYDVAVRRFTFKHVRRTG